MTNCANPVTSGGGNVTDTASCGFGPKDLLDPLIYVPDPTGVGITEAVIPIAGGPLDGLIPRADCLASLGTITVDQRGEPRPMGDCEPGSFELAMPGASVFVPLSPARVFDTRENGPAAGYVAAGETRTVQFAGVAGIPTSGASAVAFNLTLDQTAAAGFVTVSPTGQPRPFTSSINAPGAGQTVPNLVIVPLGTNGQVDFFVQRGAHLVADAVGYFTPAVEGASAGRIVPVDPVRAFDTRTAVNGYVPAGGKIDVAVTGIGDVPAEDVAAVVINLTGTEAGGAGYVTMWPAGGPAPFTASLNLAGPGHTAGNMTIVPVSADGTISIFSQSGAHFVGDVTGWVTTEDADLTTAGLFVPLTPIRWFDTREPQPAPGFVAAGSTRTVAATHAAGVPADAGAVVFNLTATEPAAAGFITGWPAGGAAPLASSLNVEAGSLRGNAAILPLGDAASVSFLSNAGAHLIADVYGFLLPGPAVS